MVHILFTDRDSQSEFMNILSREGYLPICDELFFNPFTNTQVEVDYLDNDLSYD